MTSGDTLLPALEKGPPYATRTPTPRSGERSRRSCGLPVPAGGRAGLQMSLHEPWAA